jgi:DNA-binding NarL/FixJ family response regulator
MLKTLAQILEIEGNFLLVGTTTDGCQAIRQALTMEPELVLMDYRMPHVNGIEATRRIKLSENPPLIIIVTLEDTPSRKALAKAAGADGFVKQGGDLHDQLRLVFQELFGEIRSSKPHRKQSVRPRRPAQMVTNWGVPFRKTADWHGAR